MATLFWQVIESPKLSIVKKDDREFFIFLIFLFLNLIKFRQRINFTMAKLMEMEQTDRNKIALYLFNSIE